MDSETQPAETKEGTPKLLRLFITLILAALCTLPFSVATHWFQSNPEDLSNIGDIFTPAFVVSFVIYMIVAATILLVWVKKAANTAASEIFQTADDRGVLVLWSFILYIASVNAFDKIVGLFF